MTSDCLKELKKGLYKEVEGPKYGSQHQGICPGGAMDLFSLRCANLLLEKDADAKGLEIIIAPTLQFQNDCVFVLTGARYDLIKLTDPGSNTSEQVFHATVTQAKKGQVLEFGNKTNGFRSYLVARTEELDGQKLIGRKRGSFSEVYNWRDRDGAIRLLEGPEFEYLTDKAAFTKRHWMITNDFSDMGFRLSRQEDMPVVSMKNMVSEAVADGTVQLTPKGPIILLKQRQTVGGYPRIYNAISADVDLLAQYAPNQILRFKTVNLETAQTAAKQKHAALSRLF